MIDRLTPHCVELIYQSSLKSFWRKEALRKFLRECRVTEAFLSSWSNEESKRDFLDRLFAQLQKTEKGRSTLLQMATFLVEQRSFPDLERWEDSAMKIEEATAAIKRLRQLIHGQEEEIKARKDREEAQRRLRERQAEIHRSQTDLQKLNDRLDELARHIGSADAGYEFQNWFFDLLDFTEVVNRRPYNHDGRQIDGSLTLFGTTYLVELKFTREQAGAPDIDIFFKKVHNKADNTMGVMVSMSGYSSVAIKGASEAKTPLLLLDYAHLYLVLRNMMKLQDVVDRVRRHASQTGEAFLPAEKFSGQ